MSFESETESDSQIYGVSGFVNVEEFKTEYVPRQVTTNHLRTRVLSFPK